VAQYPVLAQWVKANRGPLALLVHAVGRTRYYAPLESSDGGLIHTRVPLPGPLSYLVQVAAMRGMLELGHGNVDGAMRWASRIHRLALLVAQSPDVVSYLVGIRFAAIAIRMLQAVAKTDELPAKQLAALSVSLKAMPSLPTVTVALNNLRYTGLSMIMMLDHNGLALLNIKGMPEAEKEFVNAIWPIDYAGMMREENDIFDAEVAAGKLPGFLEEFHRMKQLKKIINRQGSPVRMILNPANVADVPRPFLHISIIYNGLCVFFALTCSH
jgi:hypothetical protein